MHFTSKCPPHYPITLFLGATLGRVTSELYTVCRASNYDAAWCWVVPIRCVTQTTRPTERSATRCSHHATNKLVSG